jgi:uncharacterized protein YgiB involved in biofilm formation
VRTFIPAVFGFCILRSLSFSKGGFDEKTALQSGAGGISAYHAGRSMPGKAQQRLQATGTDDISGTGVYQEEFQPPAARYHFSQLGP